MAAEQIGDATLYLGDCLSILPTLPDASVDAIVTDPPYGLNFMGKAWDTGAIAFDAAMWRDALRVAKPGAYLVAFGGTRTYHRLACAIEDGGWVVKDMLAWLYGQGFPKSRNLGDGRGTALKPAQEPICLAMKPLTGTYAATVEQWGTGALNIDACRVEGVVPQVTQGIARRAAEGQAIYGGGADLRRHRMLSQPHDAGRWPANLILSHSAACGDTCADDCPVHLLDEQSGATPRGGTPRMTQRNASTVNFVNSRPAYTPYADTIEGGHGASRFFYCAKASRRERGDGNTHPTVKPTALMRWLCRLATPPNGVILDPFMGSNSTGVAALAEGFRFTGIERDPDYYAIARARLSAPRQTRLAEGA